MRFSTSNKVIEYIKNNTKKGSKLRESSIKNWLLYSRKIAVGTHKETHFNKKRQFHFYQYGDKNSLFACDICDMWGNERKRISEFNSGYQYLFMFLNCLTKHLLVYPIKSRAGLEIYNAMEKAIKSSGLKCDKEGFFRTSIHCDQEFLTSALKKMCKKYCINLYYTQSNHKASMIERLIRTFKSMMVKRMEAKRSEHWLTWLKPMVNQYNENMVHSSTGLTPNQGEKYPFYCFIKLLEKYSKNKKIMPFKFKINDWVRIRGSKDNIFRKSSLRTFTAEIFQVMHRRRVNNANVYYLKDYKDRKITGCFNEQLLSLAEPDSDYDIKVLDKKGNKLLVHYDGYGSSDDEWIDKSQLVGKKVR